MIRRERSRRRPGVFRLNSGSSPFGRQQTFQLNKPGGTFGSGRSAGGGAGAGKTLAEALLRAPGLSVAGDPFHGAPVPGAPAPPPPLPEPAAPAAIGPAPNLPRPPTFDPEPVDVGPTSGTYPTWDPIILGDRKKTSGSPIRFF